MANGHDWAITSNSGVIFTEPKIDHCRPSCQGQLTRFHFATHSSRKAMDSSDMQWFFLAMIQLLGGDWLPWILFVPYFSGMSSSQLTFIFFQRGGPGPPTSQCCGKIHLWTIFCMSCRRSGFTDSAQVKHDNPKGTSQREKPHPGEWHCQVHLEDLRHDGCLRPIHHVQGSSKWIVHDRSLTVARR